MKTNAFFGVVTLGLILGVRSAFAVVAPIVAPVSLAGSDAASLKFLESIPAINATIKSVLPERTALQNATTMALDPETLRFSGDGTARVYFLSEGAAYHSVLGFNTLAPGSSIPTATTPGIMSNAKVIFPDASTSAPTQYNPSGNSVRTASEPLLPGDFVDLGSFTSGSLLDFFLIPNGASGGSSVLTDETQRNSDKLQHFVTFTVPGSTYTYFAIEDTVGGGDKDYNDAIFALEITQAPEPGTWAGMCGLGLLVGSQTLRRKSK